MERRNREGKKFMTDTPIYRIAVFCRLDIMPENSHCKRHKVQGYFADLTSIVLVEGVLFTRVVYMGFN